MISLPIAVTTEMGCHIYTEIKVREDYSMNEVVKEVKRLGYVTFRLLGSMKRYVKVQ